MAGLEFLYLDHETVTGLLPEPARCIEIVGGGLAAHGRGDVVLPPKAHIQLDDRFNGHFNILPGYAGNVGMAGVKVIGDYVDNHARGLPSEIALLLLSDPATGVPAALMDATRLTWLRTGAVTAIGARHLARPDSAVVGHLGARGTALANLLMLAALFPLREIRINSARPETREALAREVTARTGIVARPVATAREAVEGADIVVEATRLCRPTVLVEEAWLKPGACLVAYGWVMALDPRLPFAVDKLVVDDWAQCQVGGQLHPLIADGRLTGRHVYGEIGRIVAGFLPGRTSSAERTLFWHRGFAISDIVLGHHVLEQARAKGLGTPLALWRNSPEDGRGGMPGA